MPPLRDEIKQTRPFGSMEQEVQLNIERTAAVLGHAFAEALKPYGITPTQYNALRILRGAGRSGLCRNEVRERLIAQVPDVTRLLDRLEEMKLVERARSTTDRRLVATHITAAGNALLRDLDGPIADVHKRHLGHMAHKQLKELNELLALARKGV